MLISEIIELSEHSLAEEYAKKLWAVAQKKGPFFYTKLLRTHPLALEHLAKMREGFDAMEQSKGGFVYVCTHPAFPGKVKIGCTRKDAASRVHELRTAGMIGTHELQGFVAHFDASGLEARVHKYFKLMRSEREWFKTTPEQALAALARHQRDDEYIRTALCGGTHPAI